MLTFTLIQSKIGDGLSNFGECGDFVGEIFI